MKTIDPKSRSERKIHELEENPAVIRRKLFQSHSLLPYFLISLLIHGLIALIIVRQKQSLPLTKQKSDNAPIEFIIVPRNPIPDKPPPETKRRAANNSVAQGKIKPKKPSTTDKQDNTGTKPTEVIKPKPVQPTPPQPTPASESSAKPTEVIKPNLAKPSKLEPTPAFESSAKPTEGIKPNLAKPFKPEPVKPTQSAIPTPKPKPSIAAISPTRTKLAPPTPRSTPSSSGAASLLGESYQRSIQEDSGSSFFDLEANASKEAPYAKLDARQDNLAPYFDEIKRRVKRNWQPSSPGEEQLTVLGFTIQRNGQITGLRVVQTSGNQQVDRDALEAVRQSGPFDALPQSFKRDRLDIQFNFNIYIDRGSFSPNLGFPYP